MSARNWTPISGTVYNASGDNCGTGAGGFKKGNTCASKGGSPTFGSHEGILKALGLNRTHTNYRGVSYEVSGAKRVAKMLTDAKKNLESLGFRKYRDEGSIDHLLEHYEHPDGHVVRTLRTKGSGNTIIGMVTTQYVESGHKQGVSLSREAEDTSRSTGIFLGHHPERQSLIGLIDKSVNDARNGENEGAILAHERAAQIHDRIAKESAGAYAKRHRDAMGAHMIAADYHKEKAGL